jgi:hypothetical protein
MFTGRDKQKIKVALEIALIYLPAEVLSINFIVLYIKTLLF